MTIEPKHSNTDTNCSFLLLSTLKHRLWQAFWRTAVISMSNIATVIASSHHAQITATTTPGREAVFDALGWQYTVTCTTSWSPYHQNKHHGWHSTGKASPRRKAGIPAVPKTSWAMMHSRTTALSNIFKVFLRNLSGNISCACVWKILII